MTERDRRERERESGGGWERESGSKRAKNGVYLSKIENVISQPLPSVC